MNVILKSLKSIIIENKIFLSIVLFYFVLRIHNLTVPPLFNDEAIYLDWGFREVTKPGFLYYSLYDAKQPLLMWIFGIMQQLIVDPVFAGRIVSVFAGFLTLLGLYKLSNKLFNKKVALISAILYAVIPIFSFFDRQVLMESAIGTVGVWSCYFLIKCLSQANRKYFIYLGIVLGLGFFIKSTALLFIFSAYLTFFIYLFYSKNKLYFFENVFISICVLTACVFMLLINPQFWSTISSNSRYSLTLSEIFTFPFTLWISNFIINFKIMFFYLTPFVFITGFVSAILFFKKNFQTRIFILFFLIPLILQGVLTRVVSDRYLVSFLPFFVVLSAYSIYLIFKKNILLGKVFVLFTVATALSVTIFQIVNQPSYIINTAKFSGYFNSTYLNGYTSGYGVNETVSYFKNLSLDKPFVIGFAQNSGNPESSMLVYFNKSKNPKAIYMDGGLLGINLNDYDCLNTGVATYFVSRESQLAGFDKLLVRIKTIHNPYGVNTIGIFKLKENCKGKTLDVLIKENST